MSFALDHIVIAVSDLDQTVADYRALGFTVYPGGTHHGGVSHNALVIFADGSYLELIAWRRVAPENRWWSVLTGAGEGFVDFALSPDDTSRNLSAARSRGLVLDGPEPGGRSRPDNVRLDWLIVRPRTTDLPFWCGDVTPRILRVPDGAMRDHANGALGASRLLVLVKDVAVSAARYVALLGPQAVTARDGGATVAIGGAALELTAPRDEAEQRKLETRGEGLIALTLRAAKSRQLDLSLAHGADLVIFA